MTTEEDTAPDPTRDASALMALLETQRRELERVNTELRQRARAWVIEVERRHAHYFTYNPAPLIEITRAPFVLLADALSAGALAQQACDRARRTLFVTSANQAALACLGVDSIDALLSDGSQRLDLHDEGFIAAARVVAGQTATAQVPASLVGDGEPRHVMLSVSAPVLTPDETAPSTVVFTISPALDAGRPSDGSHALGAIHSALMSEVDGRRQQALLDIEVLVAETRDGLKPRLSQTTGPALADALAAALAQEARAQRTVTAFGRDFACSVDVERLCQLVTLVARRLEGPRRASQLELTVQLDAGQVRIEMTSDASDRREADALTELALAALGRALGAEIDTRTREGGGGAATVRAPLASVSASRSGEAHAGALASPKPMVPQPQAEPEPVSGPRVLVAEDNGLNQRVITAMLEVLGVQVSMTSNGEEAVAAAEADRFDLILMDVSMPILDGLEATRRIRASDGPNRAAPILAVTANTMPGDRAQVLAAGMNDILPKPIDGAALARALTHWLAGKPRARGVSAIA